MSIIIKDGGSGNRVQVRDGGSGNTLKFVQGVVPVVALEPTNSAFSASLEFWYKGDDGLFCGTQDCEIESWLDRSGNGETLTPQFNFRPTVNLAAEGTSSKFNGSNDNLQQDTPTQDFLSDGTNHTIFTVFRMEINDDTGLDHVFGNMTCNGHSPLQRHRHRIQSKNQFLPNFLLRQIDRLPYRRYNHLGCHLLFALLDSPEWLPFPY